MQTGVFFKLVFFLQPGVFLQTGVQQSNYSQWDVQCAIHTVQCACISRWIHERGWMDGRASKDGNEETMGSEQSNGRWRGGQRAGF